MNMECVHQGQVELSVLALNSVALGGLAAMSHASNIEELN